MIREKVETRVSNRKEEKNLSMKKRTKETERRNTDGQPFLRTTSILFLVLSIEVAH